MSLTADEVIQIAHLARLGIDKNDIGSYANDLSNMLDLMTQMGNTDTDTDTVQPMAHPMDQIQRLRSDEATETSQREIFQSLAPQTEAGLYLVPKVID